MGDSANLFWNRKEWIPKDNQGDCAGEWELDKSKGELRIQDATGSAALVCTTQTTDQDAMRFSCTDTLSKTSGQVFALDMTVRCRSDGSACTIRMDGKDAGTIYNGRDACQSAPASPSSTTS